VFAESKLWTEKLVAWEKRKLTSRGRYTIRIPSGLWTERFLKECSANNHPKHLEFIVATRCVRPEPFSEPK